MNGVLKGLKLIRSIIATAAYAVVACLLMIDVIGREIFATSFLGLQQVSVYGAIVAGFLGLTLATSDNAHLRPSFLDFLAGEKHEASVSRLGDFVSAGFFLFGAWVAWTFVAVSLDSGDKAPVLYFPLWPLQLVIPYAFVSAGVKHLLMGLRPDLKPASAGLGG